MIFHNIFFNSKQMIEEVVDRIVKEEKYVWENNFSHQQAYCSFQYCPSSIYIQSTTINGEEYYYLSHIPHFHKPTLYQGTPQYLPPFLQYVLQYHSGIEYFNQQLTQLSQSSHSVIHIELLKEIQSIFLNHSEETLRQSALSEFGNDIANDIIDLINNRNDDNNGKHFDVIFNRSTNI